MEDDEDAPPFWLRPGGSFRRSRSPGSSAAAIGSGAVVVLLMAAALALVFIVVPSVLSTASQIFRPHVVKKSWDSLNLVLVLFAIFCGFLSRITGGGETSYGESRSFDSRASPKSNQSMQPDQWLGYLDQVAYDRPSSFNRMRTSSSYPDLRQEPLWSQADDRRRFFDDTHIYRSRSWRDEEEVGKGNGVYGHGGTTEIKTIQVDRVEVHEKEVSVSRSPPTEPPSPPQPTPPPQQAPESSPPSHPSTSAPPRAAKRRPKRTSEALVETHALVHKPKEEYTKIIETYKLPPPPPPPPPVFDYYATPTKSDKNEKKRGGSATRDFIKSLGRNRKKQRQKSVENFETLLLGSSQPQSRLPQPSQPPPPPPLPPPPSVFHNLFSNKKGKSKKDRPPPPPPPPPAPPSRATKSRSQAATSQPRPKPTAAAGRPPAPANPIRYSDSVDLGNRSPLIPIPPPPPPPFRVPDWKFTVRGGYVRIRSSSSSASRGSSPDLMEDGQATPGGDTSPSSLSAASAGDVSEPGSPAIFCPSPDVDTKADNFIARFRAGLQIERMNSVRQRTRSNLGPDPNLNPKPNPNPVPES